MATLNTTLSVVMPVYNEERVIGEVLGELRRFVLDTVPGSNAFIVDDGSTDDTSSVLLTAAAADPRLHITRQANGGHGRALRRAYDQSDGEWIFHVDSDGQFDLSEFASFWAVREDADLLLGIRAQRCDARHRIALSAACRFVVRTLGGKGIKDANVPFRLINRPLLEHVLVSIPPSSFAPSLLISLAAVRTGARVRQLDVRHFARPFGVSTLRMGRLARAATIALTQLVRFRCTPVTTFVPRKGASNSVE